jgi:hypothetical protein
MERMWAEHVARTPLKTPWGRRSPPAQFNRLGEVAKWASFHTDPCPPGGPGTLVSAASRLFSTLFGVFRKPRGASHPRRFTHYRRKGKWDEANLDAGRGRDSGYPLPPAQSRAGATHAHGSCLGCLASKRSLGYGCRLSTAGSRLPSRFMNRPHVRRVR